MRTYFVFLKIYMYAVYNSNVSFSSEPTAFSTILYRFFFYQPMRKGIEFSKPQLEITKLKEQSDQILAHAQSWRVRVWEKETT